MNKLRMERVMGLEREMRERKKEIKRVDLEMKRKKNTSKMVKRRRVWKGLKIEMKMKIQIQIQIQIQKERMKKCLKGKGVENLGYVEE